MATLTAWTRTALKAVDPSALLVAPALVTRLTSQRAWANAFYAQKVAKKNVSAYVDALSFQLYPAANGSPESSMALLAATRAMLKHHKVTKPIWDTEVNYGLVGGPTAGAPVPAASTAQQVGNVLRTYVLNAENGVRRVYWYSWDLLGMSNTTLVQPDRITLTPAGQAFGTAQSWLLGTRPAGCSRDKKGTYTCTFTAPTETRKVIWNPSRATTVVAGKGTRSVAGWNSAPVARGKGAKISVGIVPVLVRSAR
jgi:hypothetical protein